MSDNSLKKGRFTKFSNRIGLYSNQTGNYIANTPEVVLNFPFKDTVLEGGMTKEDSGRDERFLHLEIDKRDIDTLEDPKVLTNFKYISKDGEVKLNSNSDIEFFDKDDNLKQNLLIKGNNLLALHSLKDRLAGKIKLIYIDPPYNTQSDGFKYNDSFNHSAWLTFMKNRLEVAKDLLADDGLIFVHCDYHENSYLRIIMDEIFGRDKMQREIIWFKGNTFGFAAGADNFVLSHDNIYMYSKTDSFKFNKIYQPYSDEYIKKRFTHDDNDGKGPYRIQGKNQRQYLNESKGIPTPDVWQIPVVNVMAIERCFETQKPEAIIQRIISCATDEGDLVLDFCLGSGTTCAVAHKMNRRWIGVEQMDYMETITKKRLTNVINGEQGGISKDVGWQGGGSFVYMELKKYNQEFLDRLMEVTSIPDVEAVYEDMQKNAFLKFFFDKKEFEKDENFRSKSWEERRDMLVNILDENQLYLNYQDMRDSKHKVTNDEMVLTDRFYGAKEDAED